MVCLTQKVLQLVAFDLPPHKDSTYPPITITS